LRECTSRNNALICVSSDFSVRLMFTRISIAATIILAALVWGAALWFFGVDLAWEYTKPFSFTLLAVSSILTAFDWWLWRWLPCRWFHSVPNIAGTWKGELHSSFVDPKTGRQSDPVTGIATIKQTFSSLYPALTPNHRRWSAQSESAYGQLVLLSSKQPLTCAVRQPLPKPRACLRGSFGRR
jgi:hypothetical protein